MASKRRGMPNGLKLCVNPINVDHDLSQSYLIQPEMSPSPAQFSFSPNYHVINDRHILSPGHGHAVMDQSRLLGSTSMSPLLPKSPPQCTFMKRVDGNISNRVYGRCFAGMFESCF